LREILSLFNAGWNIISQKGKAILVSYTFGLIMVSGLDAWALYLISSSFFSGTVSDVSKSSILNGIFIAFLLLAKSALAAAISYLSVKAFATEEALLAKRNIHKVTNSPWLERVEETNSYLQNVIDRGPYLLTQSNMLGVCTVIAESFSALAIVVAIMVLQPITAASLILYFLAVVLVQHKMLSALTTKLGLEVLNLTNKVYDYISDFHSLAKVLAVMKSKTFSLEVITQRNNLAKGRALQIFVSNIPRYFLEIVLIFGVVIVGSISFVFSGTAGVVAAITLFSVAGFRLLPIVNRIQVLIFAMIGSAPISRTALLPSNSKVDQYAFERRFETDDLARNELMRLEKVSFSYSQARELAIKEVTLSIQKSKQYAIVGLSGSGKTTLVDLILGLILPTSGSIILDQRLNDKIGYVPQDSTLIAGTIAQNVSLEWDTTEIDLEKVKSALMSAKADEQSIGISMTENVASSLSLSGGQRQRVAIARALYRDSQLLILDEATSALDSITEREIMDTLDSLKGSCTTIVIAHRLATVEHVDEVVYLEAGRVLGIGSFEELRKALPSFAAQIEAGMLSTEK
jgi:ABC-type multidrug transport system fused ATPase/permease subunit